MEPKLGVINGENFILVREILSSEYENYSRSAKRLVEFSSDQQLFTMVRLNYEEFEKQINDYLEQYIHNSAMNWKQMEFMSLNVNRIILNFLSIIRTFLDHTETKIKKRYGKDSGRLQRFKEICTQLYDNNFSYRFLYKLRNYAQHCGMPVGDMSLQSSIKDIKTEEISYKLSVCFKRDELLANYDSWGNPLKMELGALDEKFEVNHHISEMMKCIENINLILIEDDIPELLESVEKIDMFLNELKLHQGTPCIMKVHDVFGDGEKLDLKIEWFPLHLMDLVRTSFNKDNNLN